MSLLRCITIFGFFDLLILAEKIVLQLEEGIYPYSIVYLWNPFPDRGSSSFDLCCLFSKLIHLVHSGSKFSIEEVTARMYLEIGQIDDLFSFLSRDEDSVLFLQKRAFTCYDRMLKIYPDGVAISTPAYTIANPQCEPKFSLDLPQGSAPLLIFEPDRLVYVCFASSDTDTLILWTDSFGEAKQERWIENIESHEEFSEYLIDQTIEFMGKGGFIPRMVVCSVSGWTEDALSSKFFLIVAWKRVIRSRFEGHGSGDDGGSEEIAPFAPNDASFATTPNSFQEPVGKLFPTTPGSAYTTPQPAFSKKLSELHHKVVPQMGSVSLVSFENSTLMATEDLPFPEIVDSQWYRTDERAIIFTPSNRKVPWNSNHLESIAKSWILEQIGDFSTGIEASLHFHWQTDFNTTCFSHWYDAEDSSRSAKRSKIIKDILLGLWKERFTNLSKEWIFESIKTRTRLIFER